MPRVHHVKRAYKDHDEDIKKGDSYYWWEFPFAGKRCSKTYPRRSQLTQSGFLSGMYDFEDELGKVFAATVDAEEFNSILDDLISTVDEFKDECQDSLDAMPEHLQDCSGSGELLQERIDSLEEWGSTLEDMRLDDEDANEDDLQSAIEEAEGSTPGF